LNPSAEPTVQSLVEDALGGPQNAAFFGHAMSGSRMIASNFSGFKAFSLTILVDRIPPSYEGARISIAYELFISCQIGGVIDKSRSFPLFFIGPSEQSSIRSAQREAVFEMEFTEVETVPGRLSLACPFQSAIPMSAKDFLIQREGGVVASVKMPSVTTVGAPLVGVISLVSSDSGVCEVKVSLIRQEAIGQSLEVVSTEIGSYRIELNGMLSRRFSIPVPFSTVADFANEIVKVTHAIEFTFYGQGGAWKWNPQISVLPPQISLTKPRVVRS
jgi:hypothetical protein